MINRWEKFREQMPVTRRWAYLDHSAVAPLPAPTAQAIHDWCDEALNEGDAVWPRWHRRVEQLRSIAHQMINADEKEVALVPSTTAGINIVAEGYPWQSGDNVVTIDSEFPSNLYPWMNLSSQGVETRVVPTEQGRVDLNRVAEHCDDRTRVISLSWIGYISGWRLDLDAAASMCMIIMRDRSSMQSRDWACSQSTSPRRRWISWRRMVTSGCSDRKAPEYFILGWNIWICCGQSVSAGIVRNGPLSSTITSFRSVGTRLDTKAVHTTWLDSWGWRQVLSSLSRWD